MQNFLNSLQPKALTKTKKQPQKAERFLDSTAEKKQQFVYFGMDFFNRTIDLGKKIYCSFSKGKK